MNSPSSVVTLKTIAKLAGVSTSVVSTVLTGRSGSVRFSEETAERVRMAARQLHYRPDRMAQSLRFKEFQAIGLLTSNLFVLPHLFLHWLSLALGEKNRLLIIQITPPHDAMDHCQMLQQRCVDAVVSAETPNPSVLQRLDQIGVPRLFINAEPGIPACRLLFDETGGMRQVVEHLHQRGYHRIILHDHEGPGYWVEERRAGCRAAAEAFGLASPQIIAVKHHWTSHHGEEADLVAAACTKGTGVIVQNSAILPFLLPRLLALGLRVPDDVGVVTLSSPPPMDMGWTFAEINTRLLATTATDLLMAPDALRDNACHRASYTLNPAQSTNRSDIRQPGS